MDMVIYRAICYFLQNRDYSKFSDRSIEKLFTDQITKQECLFLAKTTNQVPDKLKYFILT